MMCMHMSKGRIERIRLKNNRAEFVRFMSDVTQITTFSFLASSVCIYIYIYI